jgi:signal transduction histidine kinase/PAS domain-containing protein
MLRLAGCRDLRLDIEGAAVEAFVHAAGLYMRWLTLLLSGAGWQWRATIFRSVGTQIMKNDNAIFEGPGEVRELLRNIDFAASGLGQPGQWPAALRTAVELMLDSTIPVRVCVGSELNLLYNDAYIGFLETRHPAALGRPYHEVWPEIEASTRPLLEQVLAGESICIDDLELILIRNGKPEPAWFTFAFAPIRNDDREVLGVFGACIEHTRQRLLEARLAEQNLRMARMFQQAPGFMAVLWGPDHVYEMVNDALYRLMGRRDYVGKPVRVAVPELADQGFYELLDGVYRTGKPFVGKGVPADLQVSPGEAAVRRYMNFVYQPIVESNGTVSGVFVEGSDVTDEYLAQVESERLNRNLEQKVEMLERAEARLAFQISIADLLRELTDPYEMLSKSSSLLGHQIAASRVVFGELDAASGTINFHSNYVQQGVHELQGEYSLNLFPWSSEALPRPGKAVVLNEDPAGSAEVGVRSSITVALHRDGTWVAVLCVHHALARLWTAEEVALVEDAALRIWTAVEHARAERALRQADQRKDEFLAMLAHELRNPLAPISAAASVIGMGKLDAQGLHRASEVITRQVHHMTALVDDLLDVSRVTRGLVEIELAPQDLKEIVAAAVEQARPLIDARRHTLLVTLPGGAALVRGDKKRLIQMVANILNNAAKYTPNGGKIEVALSVENALVRIAVTDNGIGVRKEIQEHIFDLFAQGERSADRSQGGLGLGLSLVRSMAELHHGSVQCASAGIGRGSEFTIVLPRLQQIEPPGDRIAAGVFRMDSAVTVLLVDDNADAADMLRLHLESLGHKVWTEYSSGAAIELAAEIRPMVCLLDIGLPEMDGYELARRLRAMPETSGALLVAVTGYGQEEDKLATAAAGFDDHLVKPVDMARLGALLSSVGKS